ncbi:hypothetical protein MTR67_010130 [Solanum verrucosum]|uniref:Copia protein n=1 Tax=Solanum verrucosum TaxID=315347 RepID=A0AAF0Q709_SOLVR|nr:hypothetical protein MTR67_010130 [Solanum verrucosum]
MFSILDQPISWYSKRQPTVSLSTTEAEYRAGTMAAQESTWLKQLMKDLHHPSKDIVPLYCDNLSAIRLTKNPVFHAWMKHVEVHHHFLRENVLQGEIEMKQIKTKEQVADIFTKSLDNMKFIRFREALGMIERENKVGTEGEC